ncbi:hypothetical protein TWF281_005191 [Arthrobotrys megalospora]
MSHQPSDDIHPHGPFNTPIQSINFAQSASPATSTDLFHFGAFPADQSHPAGPVSKEPVGNGPYQGTRIFRPNPLLQRPEEVRERRRNLLLRKLQTQRENRAMQARGGEDEMLRLIYLSEKNRWENSQERVALAMSSWKLPTDDDEEWLHATGISSEGLQDSDMAMAEVMADIEEQELQEIVKNYESPDPTPRNLNLRNCTRCGSDEILESSTEAICFNCGTSIDG